MEKRVRIVDEELLATVRRLPCIACSDHEPAEAIRAIREDFDCESDAHHVKTRGAGGDDVSGNVMPLCRSHHQLWHRVGPQQMRDRFKTVEHWFWFASHSFEDVKDDR